MTSLGYRREMRPQLPLPRTTPPTQSSPSSTDAVWWKKYLQVPKGFLPVLVHSGMALALSLVLMFANLVYTSNAVRGVLVGASIGTPFALAFANDVIVWYNLVLFFDIGVQSKLVQHTIEYSQGSERSDIHIFLSIAGISLIVAHLCLLLLTNRRMIVTTLTMTSVSVSSITALYVVPDLFPLVFLTSNSMLLMVLFATGCCKEEVAILSLLHKAMHEGTWFQLTPLK